MTNAHVRNILSILALFGFFVSFHTTGNAQNSVDCGQNIEGVFAGDRETHEYRIQLEKDTLIYAIGKVGDNDREVMNIDVLIYASNGRELANPEYGDLTYASTRIPETGTYTILAEGYGSFGGRYTLYISCVDSTGTVITGNRYIQNLQCGSIIESQFDIDREVHYYYINLNSNDSITANGVVAQGYEDPLNVDVLIYASNGRELANPEYGDNITASATVVEPGVYIIVAQGYGEFGGKYGLFIRCELSNGTIVEPGDVPPLNTSIDNTVTPEDFEGFGFPGIPSRDFSLGIEIPLTLGQGQTAPIANDVALYTYSALANETATLKVMRVSGDISIGIAVIKRDTNEIIFVGGLPSSNNLSVELTFPSDGTYVIGLFRLDTVEHAGTSGAVQIVIE